jgi:hypothetical protein
MTRTAIAILLAAVVLAVPAGAEAHKTRAQTRGPGIAAIFALALKDAEQYWGGAPPCRGAVTFQAGYYPARSVGGISMWTTWNDVATYQMPGTTEPATTDWLWWEGPWVDAANFTNCVIGYDPRVWPTERSFIVRWPEYAQTIAHEVEHLENRWAIEPVTDNGPLSLCAIPPAAVNFPFFNGRNEPWPAKLHKPLGAPLHGPPPATIGMPVCP